MTAIKQLLTKVESLNGAQRRLGRYLQNDSSALLLSNVNDLAQAVGVSKATVVNTGSCSSRRRMWRRRIPV